MEVKLVDSIFKRFSRPSAMDFYVLCIQVSAFLDAGLALGRALEQIAPHQKNKELKKILLDIVQDMEVGLAASEAFAKHKEFPNIFAPTIASGEQSSELDSIFRKLADQMWLRSTLYAKISSALLTPKIAGVLMGGLMVGFAKIMIPQYEKMYKESGMEMPAVIEMFVNAVNGFFDNFFPIMGILAGIFYGLRWYAHTHPKVVGRIKLKMPIYKPLHFSLINYQFASNLALMLNSGLNIVVATQQTSKVVDNYLFQLMVAEASDLIQAGDTIKDALVKADRYKAIDPLVLGFVDSGERTGSMVEMLEKAAGIHKTLLDATVDKVSTKITIVVIAPMGVLMIAMYAMSLVPMISYFSKLIGS